MQVGVYTDVLWVQEVEVAACNNCNWVDIYDPSGFHGG